MGRIGGIGYVTGVGDSSDGAAVGVYDDLYVFDGTGSLNNTFPASQPVVQCLYPTGAGGHSQWTPTPWCSYHSSGLSQSWFGSL